SSWTRSRSTRPTCRARSSRSTPATCTRAWASSPATRISRGTSCEGELVMDEALRRAEILMEAPPYIRALRGKSLLIKYAGDAMEQANLKESFALDVILLHLVGIHPIIVHGGGPQIGALMKRLGKEPRFVGGMRVTDEETVEIVEMVLVGKINKEIVGLINHHGGRAVGLSGKDGALIPAKKRMPRTPEGELAHHGPVGEAGAAKPGP